jgi:hypothetical protein
MPAAPRCAFRKMLFETTTAHARPECGPGVDFRSCPPCEPCPVSVTAYVQPNDKHPWRRPFRIGRPLLRSLAGLRLVYWPGSPDELEPLTCEQRAAKSRGLDATRCGYRLDRRKRISPRDASTSAGHFFVIAYLSRRTGEAKPEGSYSPQRHLVLIRSPLLSVGLGLRTAL